MNMTKAERDAQPPFDPAYFKEATGVELRDLFNPEEYGSKFLGVDDLLDISDVNPAAIGPVYRGAPNAEGLENLNWFTESPEYANEYAYGLSTDYHVPMDEEVPDFMTPTMGKYEIPDDKIVDFKNDIELRAQFVDWLKKEYPDSRADDIFTDTGYPHFESEPEVREFLDASGRDWDTTMFDNGMDAEEIPSVPNPYSDKVRIEYLLKDPEMAKLAWGLRKPKE